jgi:hypothetical protein
MVAKGACETALHNIVEEQKADSPNVLTVPVLVFRMTNEISSIADPDPVRPQAEASISDSKREVSDKRSQNEHRAYLEN